MTAKTSASSTSSKVESKCALSRVWQVILRYRLRVHSRSQTTSSCSSWPSRMRLKWLTKLPIYFSMESWTSQSPKRRLKPRLQSCSRVSAPSSPCAPSLTLVVASEWGYPELRSLSYLSLPMESQRSTSWLRMLTSQSKVWLMKQTRIRSKGRLSSSSRTSRTMNSYNCSSSGNKLPRCVNGPKGSNSPCLKASRLKSRMLTAKKSTMQIPHLSPLLDSSVTISRKLSISVQL